MDKAVKLTENIVRDVTRCSGLTVEEYRDIRVFKPDFRDELAKVFKAECIEASEANSSSSIERMKAEARDCCWANWDKSP